MDKRSEAEAADSQVAEQKQAIEERRRRLTQREAAVKTKAEEKQEKHLRDLQKKMKKE